MRGRAQCDCEDGLGWSSALVLVMAAVLVGFAAEGATAAHGQTSPEAKGVRTVGAIKAITNGTLTVTADSGEEVMATLGADTKIVRVAPGQKDLKGATVLRVEDLQSGDRVLVRGLPLSDGKTLKAVSIIVMKQADVTSKQDQDREDWQRRGVGGLVTTVDTAAGTITVSLGGAAPGAPEKTITVHTTKETVLLRYAATSIKFDDAKPAPITEIKAGDQLRARGTRSLEGSDLAADEVISGSFRNIAGTILAKDDGTTTITVQDVLSKKPVAVKIAGDSTVKALPPEMAQRIAMRLKGGGTGGNGNGSPTPGGMRPTAVGAGGGNPGGRQGEGRPAGGLSGTGGASGGGTPDLQRFLGRLPSKTLTDLNKGDAVMIVATEGGDGKPVTAITLLAGVEPILTAAPNGALSSWTLGSSIGEGGGPQ